MKCRTVKRDNRKTNISRMTRDQAEKFARFVLDDLALYEWYMEWEKIDPIGFCYQDLKYFTVPPWILKKSAWNVKEYVLHEIAHAIANDRTNIHWQAFYDAFGDLVKKYMCVDYEK